MTKAEVADELVRTIYNGFATETLKEMAALGKDLRQSAIPSEDAELFQAALEREIERRGLSR